MKISLKAKGLQTLKENLKNIANKGSDTAPLMAELANHLYNTTFNSLRNETSPDGIKWNPIKAATVRAKKRNKSKALYDTGNLRDSLTSSSSKNEAIVGLNATKGGYPYPAVHQFGSKTTPARPFLPIRDDENLYENVVDELEEIVEDFVRDGNLLK
jgi:phage virion morphogenesis protein